jgi:hypothetical protein
MDNDCSWRMRFVTRTEDGDGLHVSSIHVFCRLCRNIPLVQICPNSIHHHVLSQPHRTSHLLVMSRAPHLMDLEISLSQSLAPFTSTLPTLSIPFPPCSIHFQSLRSAQRLFTPLHPQSLRSAQRLVPSHPHPSLRSGFG